MLIFQNMQCSNILDGFIKILTGAQLSFKFLSPFLNTSIMFVLFGIDGKELFETKQLKKTKEF